MVNGNSVKIGFAEEATFGTVTAPLNRVEVTSESLAYTAEKSAEELLTGGIAGGRSDTMGISASGNVATLAKPTSVGVFLKHVFGVEEVTASDTKYSHVFTPIGNKETDFLPSITWTVDRSINSILAYTGMTANTLNFSASPGDRLTIDVAYLGKTEEAGTSLDDAGVLSKNEKAFKFHQATIKMNGETVADVTNITFDYNNNLDNAVQTTDTGLYHKQPQAGQRECTVALDAIYTNTIETIRTEKFKTDDVVSLEVMFTDENGNSLKIELPQAQINEMANATATGADTLSQSMTIGAIDNEEAFVRVTLVNDTATEY